MCVSSVTLSMGLGGSKDRCVREVVLELENQKGLISYINYREKIEFELGLCSERICLLLSCFHPVSQRWRFGREKSSNPGSVFIKDVS